MTMVLPDPFLDTILLREDRQFLNAWARQIGGHFDTPICWVRLLH